MVNPRLITEIDTGGWIDPDVGRTFRIAESLAELGHKVDFASLYDGSSIRLPKGAVRLLFLQYRDIKLSKHPLLRRLLETLRISPPEYLPRALFVMLPPFALAFRKAFKESDVVILVGFPMAIFVAFLARLMQKKFIFDACAPMSLGAKRLADEMKGLGKLVPFIRYKWISVLEHLICKMSHQVFVATCTEAEFLNRELGVRRTKISIIPMCIDLDDFPASVDSSEVRNSLNIAKNDVMLLFLGNLKSLPNFEAAKFCAVELLPKVKKSITSIKLVHVGEKGEAKFLDNRPNIVSVGKVPNFIDFIRAADICLSPISKGVGVRSKLLVYMACGKAVVTTPEAVEGAGIRNGVEAIVTALDSFDKEISRLIENPGLREALGLRARQLVTNRFDRKCLPGELEKALLSIAAAEGEDHDRLRYDS